MIRFTHRLGHATLKDLRERFPGLSITADGAKPLDWVYADQMIDFEEYCNKMQIGLG